MKDSAGAYNTTLVEMSHTFATRISDDLRQRPSLKVDKVSSIPPMKRLGDNESEFVSKGEKYIRKMPLLHKRQRLGPVPAHAGSGYRSLFLMTFYWWFTAPDILTSPNNQDLLDYTSLSQRITTSILRHAIILGVIFALPTTPRARPVWLCHVVKS